VVRGSCRAVGDVTGSYNRTYVSKQGIQRAIRSTKLLHVITGTAIRHAQIGDPVAG